MSGSGPTVEPTAPISPSRPLPRAVGRVLSALAILEVATLGVLLGNLWTVHLRPITQAIGPVHGAVYLSVVAIVLVAPGLRPVERALGCIPVVGGPIARILAARRGAR